MGNDAYVIPKDFCISEINFPGQVDNFIPDPTIFIPSTPQPVDGWTFVFGKASNYFTDPLTNPILDMDTLDDVPTIEGKINGQVINPADCVIKVVSYDNNGLRVKIGLRQTLVVQEGVGHYEANVLIPN